MLRGTIVHAVLESYGRTGSYDTAEAAARYHGYLSLSGDIREALVRNIDTAVSRLLDDNNIRDLITAGETRHHELELLVEDGGRTVFGCADLVTITGDTARVIDYKTGYTSADREDIIASYAPQLELYGKAIGYAFGIKKTELVLILVDRAEAVFL